MKGKVERVKPEASREGCSVGCVLALIAFFFGGIIGVGGMYALLILWWFIVS